MPDLGRPDTEGEGAEGTVCARMAVAANDRFAGLRRTELGADDVHDSAMIAVEAEQVEPELAAVFFHLANLVCSTLA